MKICHLYAFEMKRVTYRKTELQKKPEIPVRREKLQLVYRNAGVSNF